jgi:hypothetical protein
MDNVIGSIIMLLIRYLDICNRCSEILVGKFKLTELTPGKGFLSDERCLVRDSHPAVLRLEPLSKSLEDYVYLTDLSEKNFKEALVKAPEIGSPNGGQSRGIILVDLLDIQRENRMTAPPRRPHGIRNFFAQLRKRPTAG